MAAMQTLAYVLAAVLFGAVLGVLGSPSGTSTGSPVVGSTVWVAGDVTGHEAGALRVSSTGGEPLRIEMRQAAAFRCREVDGSISCDSVRDWRRLRNGRSVCAAVTVQRGGSLRGIKVFANATCSLAPAPDGA